MNKMPKQCHLTHTERIINPRLMIETEIELNKSLLSIEETYLSEITERQIEEEQTRLERLLKGKVHGCGCRQ